MRASEDFGISVVTYLLKQQDKIILDRRTTTLNSLISNSFILTFHLSSF